MRSRLQHEARSSGGERRRLGGAGARAALTAGVVLLAAIALVWAARYASVTRALRGLLPGWPWW